MSASYAATHAALRRTRGPASAYPCAEPGCPRRAREWSCDCDDSSVIDGMNASGRRVRFSPDVRNYSPRCREHHRAHDAAIRAGQSLVLSPLPKRSEPRRMRLVAPTSEPLETLW